MAVQFTLLWFLKASTISQAVICMIFMYSTLIEVFDSSQMILSNMMHIISHHYCSMCKNQFFYKKFLRTMIHHKFIMVLKNENNITEYNCLIIKHV